MSEHEKEILPHNLEEAQKRIRELEDWAGQIEKEQQELSKSELEHRTAFENSGTGMVVIREDMMVIMANRRIQDIIGFSSDEVRYKRKWTDFVLPEDIPMCAAYHFARRKYPESAPSEYEFRVIDKDHAIRWVLATVAMIPGTTHSLVSMLDITSRKNMERALRESEQRFKETADLLPGIIAEMDTSLNLTYINTIGIKAFGFSQEDIEKGVNANEFIFPEDRERIATDMSNIFHGDFGNPSIYRFSTRHKTVLHVLINAAPIVREGTINGIRTCIIDVSEQVAGEAKLKASEERFRTIFQQSPIGIALMSREGSLLDMNQAFRNMFAHTEREGVLDLFSLMALTAEGKERICSGAGLQRETSIGGEGAAEGSSGSPKRWFDWHITPLGSGTGDTAGCLVQVEEVTLARQEQEMKLAKQREATQKAEALVAGLRYELLEKARFHSMVSRSPDMRKIFDTLPEIACAEAPVFISGESGTGKELVAQSLHDLSSRKGKPFIAINCGALPDTLLESELFGYRAGAFTDAKKDKPGKFALAEGGTIFFDEIGDISPAMQVKLLRVLQERKYEPLGATSTVKTDVRVVAATNRDLDDMVKKGTFREDLFYRINVVAVALPPLRDRRCDIPLLCDHFIERFNARFSKGVKGISQEAMEVILAHDFPGNIRELENLIEHAFVFCKEEMVQVQHLPAAMRKTVGGSESDVLARIDNFDELEKMYINAVLKEVGGNKEKASQRLGVHKATLFRKLKKLGI
ncbi:MAG: sigma 54-interacting transcriptional regulator [Chitinispirillaceae bacterium]|nr:sigma 54-interacting transcriptional regulator [Chitinispirillaceae bacterium]